MMDAVYQVVGLTGIVRVSTKSLILLQAKLLLTRLWIYHDRGRLSRTLDKLLLLSLDLFFQATYIILLPVGRNLIWLKLYLVYSQLLDIVLAFQELHFEELHIQLMALNSWLRHR